MHPSGTTILHYTITGQLGEGGMGVVYKARDTRLDRDVALKFLPASGGVREEELSRFLQEARTAATLNHPHITTVFAIESADHEQFIVMEYVDGRTLRSLCTQADGRAPLAVDDVLRYAIQIAEALSEAHGKGIVHQDIKSENIMVNDRGDVKVMDFGLAHLLHADAEQDAVSSGGTLSYMAPEQIQGGRADFRSDIFSFGVVLYEMLTGRLPFHGGYAAMLHYSIIFEAPAPVTEFRDDVYPGLLAILQKMLRKNPEERYQRASELLDDLRALKDADAAHERHTAGLASPEIPQPSASPNPLAAIRSAWRARALVAGAVVLAAVALLFFLLQDDRRGALDSIAVLPLKNLSDDRGDEYFSDGLTDDIIAHLAGIPGLKVISRTSAMQYKDTKKSLTQIAEDLAVAAVLEGSVRRSGGRMRIVLQLVDAESDAMLWAQTYEREVADLFEVQRDIARQVTNGLQMQLSGPDEARIQKTASHPADAYQSYSKGRYFLNKWSKEGADSAMTYFQRAIQQDASYAEAWTGIADCYLVYSTLWMPPSEAFPKARKAAEKALTLNPSLAEARSILGYVIGFFDRDRTRSEKEFLECLSLKPGYALGHFYYGAMLIFWGDLERAQAEMEKARVLDPLSVIVNCYADWTVYLRRDYDGAIQLMQKTIRMFPDSPIAYGNLVSCYLLKGQHDEGIRMAEKARALFPGSILTLGIAYAKAGRTREARAILDTLESTSAVLKYRDDMGLCILSLALKDTSRAIDYLAVALAQQSENTLAIAVDPALDMLHDHPRFVALLRRYKIR